MEFSQQNKKPGLIRAKHSAAGIRKLVVEHGGSGYWLHVAHGAVAITRLSFGAAGDYTLNGGQPVLSDFSSRNNPQDLSLPGAEVWPVGVQAAPAIGAFVRSDHGRLSVRAVLTRRNGDARSIFVRAHVRGVERVPATQVMFDSRGHAEVDLPVRNVPLDVVGTISEDWVWDLCAEGKQKTNGWRHHATMPVRLYVIAAKPDTVLPCETFYHLACSVAGARIADGAIEAVWSHFRDSGGLTTVRGENLTMWGTQRPSTGSFEYMSRCGQALVVHKDSSCNAWAHLLVEVLGIHGIKSSLRLVSIDRTLLKLNVPEFHVPLKDGTTLTVGHVGMVIRSCNWDGQGSLKPGVEFGPDFVRGAGDFRWKLNVPEDSKGIPWDRADVRRVEQPGHLAKGSNSTGVFSNHVVVLIEKDGQEWWYDPCYAIGPCRTLLEYQHALLGVGQSGGGGLYAIVGCQIERERDPATGQDAVVRMPKGYYGFHPAPCGLCFMAEKVQEIER